MGFSEIFRELWMRYAFLKIYIYERPLSAGGNFINSWHDGSEEVTNLAITICFADGHAEFVPDALRGMYGDVPGKQEW